MRDTSEDSGASPSEAALLDRLEQHVDASRLPLARTFARTVLRRITDAEVAEFDADAMAAEIAAAFQFVDTREPGQLAVRAIDPPVRADRTGRRGTLVEVCVEDRPFLLSTVTEELRVRGHGVVRSLHPILGVRRGADGRIVDLISARQAASRESLIHVELDSDLTEEEGREVEAGLREVLSDALAATGDFDAMRRRVDELVDVLRKQAAEGVVEGSPAEVADFLEWLLDDNFVFLGSRIYRLVEADGRRAIVAAPESELGILAGPEGSRYEEPTPVADADEGVRRRHAADALLEVARSRRISTVHRRVRMLNVWVKRVDADRGATAEVRFLGLFTRKAHTEPSSSIPVLRRKLETILTQEDVVAESHDERVLASLFEAVPKEDLFELELAELRDMLFGLLAAEEQHDVRLMTRIDDFTGIVMALLAVPRDRYDANLRRAVQRLLVERYQGDAVDVGLSLGDLPEAVVRFAIHVDGKIPEVAPDELEREVQALCRSWQAELQQALVDRFGNAEGHRLHRTYGVRLPPAYRDHTTTARAVEDVALLDELVREGGDLRIALHDDPLAERPLTRLKILKRGEGIELSAILPILESLGLTVAEELPFRLTDPDEPAGGGEAPELHVHDYGVHDAGSLVDVAADGPRLAAAVVAGWRGDLEVDSLNRLVLHAGLGWSWVVVLRTYRRYRRQIGTAYTAEYQNDALVANPQVVRALVELFEALFDPDRDDEPDEVENRRQAVHSALEDVGRLDHDRILRAFLALVEATLRTNRYRGEDPAHVTLKLDSARVPLVERPAPHREIFVYTPEVEGIHLRGGPVARGGIRWSDRRDDLRTEILDLMQAQMLKNAVIVPTGAKGGFVLKRDAADVGADIRRQYRTFIHALLEITDNVESGEVVAPEGVRRHDGDDPYLVVAADRGTAGLSDTANAIAEERGFWLGDAFASGGSRGYDHKGLGITARGAWVAVDRHFRELGVDVDSEPVTVVGIGDMSGDVFGNGMLQSRAIRLVAAFDHRDVFLDPDPDPETAYAVRRRLFDDPSLTWQDYDREAISAGGGVWPRTDKRIPLAPEVRERLRIDAEELAPPDLIRAILTAPVDLLFAGGIGTYVKASHESHDEIGDRANDELRVDATEVRARVIGEGANLSITPGARVQYARRGGRLNADFVDNSAGVDISDHEVNFKILLALAAERGALDPDERDGFLEAVTDDVVAACLRDVALQTWRLSQESRRSQEDVTSYASLAAHLEDLGLVDREFNALPTNEEMNERAEVGAGLTRPELAVLLAAEKRHLYTEIVDSGLPDQPGLRPALEAYFPARFVDRFGALLDDHPLRRELVATVVSNDVVNRMGVTFVRRLAQDLGASPADIAAAYWIARGVADVARYWSVVDEVDTRDTVAGLELKERVDGLLEAMSREYLHSAELDDVASATALDRPAFVALEATLRRRTDVRGRRARRAEDLAEAGLDVADAIRMASVADLALAPDVASVARAADRDESAVATAFLDVGDALGLPRLQRLIAAIEPGDRWERRQHRGLVDDVRALHRVAVHRALTESPEMGAGDAVERFVAGRREAIDRALHLARQVETDPDAPGLSAAQVALRVLRDALRRTSRRP